MSVQVEKASGVSTVEQTGRKFRSARASSKAWTTSEIRKLRELAGAGVPMQLIAIQLGRTVSAIKNKAGFHGISVHSSLSSHTLGE